MGLLSLKQDMESVERLREIVTVAAKHGLRSYLHTAKLHHHISIKHFKEEAKLSPETLREIFEELGPTFVKLGQLLSLRPDLVPLSYAEEFRKLQNDVKKLTLPVVKGVIEAELGKPLESIFKEFTLEPLASASVAQVHKATLKNGEHVVVKVQRPGIHAVMEKDITVMELLAEKLDKKFPILHAKEIVAEFKSYTERELNFTRELQNIDRFHTFFKKQQQVIIPATYPELSTPHILVMEFLKGISLNRRVALKRAKISREELAKVAVGAIFTQAFELGIFHADPHPGNLLAVKGKNISLAFLDYGIVGYLDQELQEELLALLRGLLTKDARLVTNTLLRLGREEKGFNRQRLSESIRTTLMEWDGSWSSKQKMSHLLVTLLRTSLHHHLRMPPNIILIGKAFLTIEGTGSWLDPKTDFVKLVTPLIQKLLIKRSSPTRIGKELLNRAAEVKTLLRDAPSRADTVLRRLEEGKVEVQINTEEFQGIEQYYDLETTKTNLAIISGAFFIGSALITGLAPELTIFDIPLYALGFSFFFVTFIFFSYVTIKLHKYMVSR